MQSIINNDPAYQLEIVLQENNSENHLYGLEYIMDEFYDKTTATKSPKNEQATLDWFGLSDLCI